MVILKDFNALQKDSNVINLDFIKANLNHLSKEVFLNVIYLELNYVNC